MNGLRVVGHGMRGMCRMGRMCGMRMRIQLLQDRRALLKALPRHPRCRLRGGCPPQLLHGVKPPGRVLQPAALIALCLQCREDLTLFLSKDTYTSSKETIDKYT